MSEQRLADLARLYTLSARIHDLGNLKAAFRAYIRKTGLALILDEDKARFDPTMSKIVGFDGLGALPSSNPGRHRKWCSTWPLAFWRLQVAVQYPTSTLTAVHIGMALRNKKRAWEKCSCRLYRHRNRTDTSYGTSI